MPSKQLNKGLRSPAGAISAIVLGIAGVGIGVLSYRAAAANMASPSAPSAPAIAASNPGVVLGRAEVALLKQRGILSTQTLAEVRRAAAHAPLDARAFLILGHQQLLESQPKRAEATLEAGRRLDPRERAIHLLLLDGYLRAKRYTEAAAEFAVLARLVGPAQAPIAQAVAEMSKMPETREAVRQTLRTDPMLERSVLVTLAKSDVPPAELFNLASSAARRDARNNGSWGPVLVSRLIDKKQYGAARAIWQQVYGLPAAQAAAPLYDAGLQGMPGSPPFNWTLAAGSLGAADMRNGMLLIDYYGRDSGDLANQLLVLRPGSYRFRFAMEGKTPDGPGLFWSLRCANDAKAELMRLPVKGTGPRRAIAAAFTVTPACPAQRLTLVGEAGEFPSPINVTVRDLDLRAVPGSRS